MTKIKKLRVFTYNHPVLKKKTQFLFSESIDTAQFLWKSPPCSIHCLNLFTAKGMHSANHYGEAVFAAAIIIKYNKLLH